MASDYEIVAADECEDANAGSEVPGEFRSMTDLEEEEVYLVTRGTLTMRFGDDVHEVDDFWEASPDARQSR